MTPMEEHQLRHVFFPYADDRSKEVIAQGHRFVYYTNAETAYRIIRNREIWMRSTSTMNDYSEVEHGFACLNAAYKSESGTMLRGAIDACYPGLSEEVVAHFNAWLPGIRSDTYITCLSEHLSEEDRNGRLSMWRAYGGKAGVAVVINTAALFLQADGIGVFASPVAYWTQEQVEAELRRVAERIRENSQYVSSLGRETTRGIVFNMFRFALLCTKHPGFAEEREWRIIASPPMHSSPILTQSVEVIRKIPQTVQKLQFANNPEAGIVGLALPDLLNRLIIGPCDYPVVVLQALRQVLQEAEVPQADGLIYVSDIPLRIPQ